MSEKEAEQRLAKRYDWIQQFKAGGFTGPKGSGSSRFFPGGGAAIDLVNYTPKNATVTLYELKAGKHDSMMIVSELFFYLAVMRKLCAGQYFFRKN